jgi:hypothetical protein
MRQEEMTDCLCNVAAKAKGVVRNPGWTRAVNRIVGLRHSVSVSPHHMMCLGRFEGVDRSAINFRLQRSSRS